MSTALTMTIRCPACGHVSAVEAPTDRCVLVHDCPGCGVELRREPGSCCVYCSHKEEAGAADAR